ncbi:MAG: sigma-70 family RNA polymerase sigma factor [Acidobacteriota bacterium]|nr:sigma-70 family RNA polymerase sigma factor [Acidobacteriota bacterium]
MTDFESVVNTYGPALRRLASAWERDVAAREDLLQEILLALWRSLTRFRGECSEKTFVYRVAHNRALTHRFRTRVPTDSLDAAAPAIDPGPTPEAEASATQRIEVLMRALQSLPTAPRQILTLALEGLTRAEIAEILGITENNAGVRLSRARRMLTEKLNE